MLLKEIKEFIESPTRFINFFPLTNGQNFILVWILLRGPLNIINYWRNSKMFL
jgi:hypothetical protein